MRTTGHRNNPNDNNADNNDNYNYNYNDTIIGNDDDYEVTTADNENNNTKISDTNDDTYNDTTTGKDSNDNATDDKGYTSDDGTNHYSTDTFENDYYEYFWFIRDEPQQTRQSTSSFGCTLFWGTADIQRPVIMVHHPLYKRLFRAKPLSKPMLGYCQLDP